MYLQTIAETAAEGRIAEIYQAQKAQMGFVMTALRCFTTRPDLLPVYNDFVDGVKAGFSLGPRGWRLITLIAAQRAKSTYCSFVFGRQLIADLGSKEAVIALLRDYRNAGLTEREVEMLAYADQVASDASQVTPAHIDRLRAVGFTDVEISDIALCAAFRCFISRFFDATGAGPEAAFIDDDAVFRNALTVGRAFE